MLSLLLAATISAANIKSHIDFLASDLLEGRETGSRGYDVAAQYVATQFASYGLEPAGENGTYFQHFQLRSALVDEKKSSITLGGRKLTMRGEAFLQPLFVCEPCDVDAPIVFAGFGQESEYANVDARGAIVLLLSGAPPQLPNDERAYYSDATVKKETAARHGAVGILTLKTITDEKRRPYARNAAQAAMRSMRPTNDPGPAAIHASGAISRETAAKLLGLSRTEAILIDAEKGITHPFALKKRGRIHTVSTFTNVTSENVVARWKGTIDENVVLSAHLDHIGLAPNGDDRVYNGALDNASGIAALLEIARSFAALPQRPRRSVVFVAVTGEEKGELGSQFFATHPTVTPMVANINMDMLTMLFPIRDLVALGAEHTTLGPMAIDAAKQAGFEVSPDPQPEEVRFIRSDQFSFVKQGIPAITYKGGIHSADPSIDGEKLLRAWLKDAYHGVADNPDQKLDYASGARWADANFILALAVANAPEKPAWTPGDFFGERFGR